MDDLRTRTHTPKTTSAVNEPNCALNTSENLQPLLPFFLFEMFKLSKSHCQNGACFLLNLYLKRLWQWTKVLPGKKCGSAETPKCPPSPHFSNTAAVVLIDGHLTRFLQRKDICLKSTAAVGSLVLPPAINSSDNGFDDPTQATSVNLLLSPLTISKIAFPKKHKTRRPHTENSSSSTSIHHFHPVQTSRGNVSIH